MKRIILTLLFIAFCIPTNVCAEKIKIVTTIGQITDITQNIGGDLVEVQGLMGPGVDPHLYKASESDVRKLSEAQIIFFNGIHLEAKMADIFKKMSRNKVTVAVAESLPKELLLGSIQYKDQFDPHIWFDVQLWKQVVSTINETLQAYDPQNKSVYAQNTENYLTKLDQLDQYVTNRSLELSDDQRILVTAHDAFRYFGKKYDFEVLGLQGISTESKAGTKDVMRLADTIAERKIRAMFVESSIPERNIKAVQEAVKARGWNVKIGGELFSDAMGHEGTIEGTYIGMVRHNIDTVVNGLKE